MKHPDQIAESIERFRRGLWNRESVDRPPVAVAPDRSWLPVNYLKAPFLREEVRPEDVTRSLVRTDYEDASFERRVFCDDWLPYNAPWRAVPWLEAISGCRVPHAFGSLSGAHFVERVEDLAALPIPAHNDWLDCLRAATELIDKRPEPPPPEVRAQCLQPEDVAATILFALSLPERACVAELTVLANALQTLGRT